jgi:hypothetical protein
MTSTARTPTTAPTTPAVAFNVLATTAPAMLPTLSDFGDGSEAPQLPR